MEKFHTNEGLYKQGLMDLFDKLTRRMKNMNYSDGGLAIGSSSKLKIKLANTVNVTIDGVPVAVTTAEYPFTATTHDIPANASTIQEAMYVLTVDESSVGHIYMGAIASGAGAALMPEYADIPEDEAVVGALRLAVAAGTTNFDATTDELDEGHLTDTYYDLSMLFPKFSAEQ